jgi:hypothetical protein
MDFSYTFVRYDSCDLRRYKNRVAGQNRLLKPWKMLPTVLIKFSGLVAGAMKLGLKIVLGIVLILTVSSTIRGADADETPLFTEEDYNWWAIQPLRDPDVPGSKGDSWVRNSIDQFILEKLREAKLQPAPAADPYELVRRVYFDLHGLPPSPGQVDAFVNAATVDFNQAYESLIDDLLDSTRYGERWGQHWLDVARYAESEGYRADWFRPTVYLYRDYVVESFNKDKPYDQFIKEQLAGDEINADDPATVIGTAFLRNGVYEYNQRDARFHWELIINEITNVTGEAFLGLGFGCAQCHDHKFDPILQKDYYALQAFLSTIYWPDGKKLATPEEEKRYFSEVAIWNNSATAVRDELKVFQQPYYDSQRDFSIKQFPPDIQEMYNKPFADRSSYEKQMAELVEKQVIDQTGRLDYLKELQTKEPDKVARYQALLESLRKLEKSKAKDLPEAYITTDISSTAVAALLGGRNGKEEVEPAFLTLLGHPKPDIRPTESTTGRRTALANWIASPENPLSTRVMANRLWHYHFGSGIVPTPNDFGTLGEDPSHPELLDWLTARFIENGWKMKPIHRLIMNSATYLQTAAREPGEQENQVDPDNRLLWRFSPTRLSAEQARDAMLVASGEMQHRIGGPSLEGDSAVRSIYIKKLRNKPEKFLHSFDAPQGFDSAPDRLQTTTPIQSLLMVNSDWPLQRAASFAKRILGDNTDYIADEQVSEAFKIAYNRPPSDKELNLAREFIDRQMSQLEEEINGLSESSEFKDTALFSIDEGFSSIDNSLSLGDMALHLEPGSSYERLELPGVEITGDAFTVEAVVILNSLHDDASISTLISQWNGDPEQGGWSIGVTSTQSKYDPRNFIVQLVGENSAGNMEYEVVASGLRVPLGKPVYLAAAISANKQSDERGGGNVVFFFKDLSDRYAPLETRIVPHAIAHRIHFTGTKQILGGRDDVGHLWNGQIARLSISDYPLTQDGLFISSQLDPEGRWDWQFSGSNAQTAIPDGATWMLPSKLEKAQDPLFGAVTDFCHALITSNAFLYLH